MVDQACESMIENKQDLGKMRCQKLLAFIFNILIISNPCYYHGKGKSTKNGWAPNWIQVVFFNLYQAWLIETPP